ncbi:hypothetical protein [Parafrankia colletiae]|nr:hypothetical protein [Parafrankia colletiae]
MLPSQSAWGRRFDKLAVRYEATIHLAAINEGLRPLTGIRLSC